VTEKSPAIPRDRKKPKLLAIPEAQLDTEKRLNVTRSSKIPEFQYKWRSQKSLHTGSEANVDLTGALLPAPRLLT
jgi:hypothetical protein